MSRTALVTGANQGLGYGLVEELAARMTPDDLVLLTGRNKTRVEEAVARPRPDARARVEGRVLDVSDPEAVATLAKSSPHIVISNAIAPLTPNRPQQEQADEFIAVANGGTDAILRAFSPPPGGRLLVVASALGTLGRLNPNLHPLLDNATLDEVATTVEEWRKSIHDGTAEEKGWPQWLNVPSKVAQVAAVRAVASQRRTQDLADGTLIAAVCPGLVDTRASRPWFADFSQAQTPRQAAAAIVDLALNPLDPSTYGELIQFGKVIPWHHGQPPSYQEDLLA